MAKKTVRTAQKPVPGGCCDLKEGTYAEPKVDPTPVNPPPDQPIQVLASDSSRA